MMEETVRLDRADEQIQKLVRHLEELEEMKQHNTQVGQEVADFVRTLNSNLQFLRSKLPKSISRQALELEEASRFMEEGLNEGKFKSLWTAKETSSKLKSLRKKLLSVFQMAFFITSLDVAINGRNRMSNFQERMLELSSAYTSDSVAATARIQELLQPIISTVHRQDRLLQNIIDYVEETRARKETESTNNEKFFIDVLAAVSRTSDDLLGNSSRDDDSDDEEFRDPITKDLMCDPVKGSDGFTYDRWTILDNGITISPFTKEPLSIVCEDINVRRRLFHKFQSLQVEKKFTEKRQEYRSLSLELEKNGHEAEALEMLENVLKWAPRDSECQHFREVIKRRLAKFHASASSSSESADLEAIDQSAAMDEQLKAAIARAVALEAELASKDSDYSQTVATLSAEIRSLKASLEGPTLFPEFPLRNRPLTGNLYHLHTTVTVTTTVLNSHSRFGVHCAYSNRIHCTNEDSRDRETKLNLLEPCLPWEETSPSDDDAGQHGQICPQKLAEPRTANVFNSPRTSEEEEEEPEAEDYDSPIEESEMRETKLNLLERWLHRRKWEEISPSDDDAGQHGQICPRKLAEPRTVNDEFKIIDANLFPQKLAKPRTANGEFKIIDDNLCKSRLRLLKRNTAQAMSTVTPRRCSTIVEELEEEEEPEAEDSDSTIMRYSMVSTPIPDSGVKFTYRKQDRLYKEAKAAAVLSEDQTWRQHEFAERLRACSRGTGKK
ncbi:hypothetical protein R1flu_012732 [Riccia fluitans]|uniref:U-box domain-containing protein n=1 Tax=Riccia fluitans TaxID=41844 RepID=A0ABD1ZBM2_9MARC